MLLDSLGVDLIEGGYPGASLKDRLFFKTMRDYVLTTSRLAAFTSTRRAGSRVDLDEGLNSVLDADVDVAVVYGKAWRLHVESVLKTSLEENLDMVYDSVRYLKTHGLRVIFDAEHFYQGYRDDPDYALSVLSAAAEGGADTLVLCDTNGGMLPAAVYEITRKVVEVFSGKAGIGVHMHNDCGCAVANTLEAARAGARHVQGTINGLGERTGNADLVQVLPGLAFKMGYEVLGGADSLRLLKKVSQVVYDASGLKPDPRQPYVGDYAFRHKAGTHIDAVLKNPRAYEHVDPESVGSTRSFEITHLSGLSALAYAASRVLGRAVDKSDHRLKSLLRRVKEMEAQGYNLSEAQGTLSLMILEEYCGRVERLQLRELAHALREAYAGYGARSAGSSAEMPDPITLVVGLVAKKLGFEEAFDLRELSVKKLENAYRAAVTTLDGVSFQKVSPVLLEAIAGAVVDALVYQKLSRASVALCRGQEERAYVYEHPAGLSRESGA